MPIYDKEDIRKALNSYKKEMDVLDMKMFISKIGTIGLISVSAIVGLVVGNITEDLLRWMVVSIAGGGVISIPLITEYMKAKDNYKIDKKEVKILNERLQNEKENSNSKEIKVEKVNTTTKTNNYSYNKDKVTNPDIDKMIGYFTEKDFEEEEKTSKKR